jgi:hypothetical protein
MNMTIKGNNVCLPSGSWIAQSEKDTDNAVLEKRLWDAADQFRAISGLIAARQPGRGVWL